MMQPELTFSQAVNTLQRTGAVTLPGAPAVWSKTIGVLFTVLLVLVPVVAVGGLVFAAIAALTGTQFTGATVFGLLTGTLMLAGVMVVLVMARRRHRANGEQERLAVWMGRQGLMLRGVGPIPWGDFGPAHHDLVP